MSGDPELAAIMRRLQPRAPMERIAQECHLETALSLASGTIKDVRRRVVVLACGHYAVTAAAERAACHKCHEMILNGEDYQAFRFGAKETDADQ